MSVEAKIGIGFAVAFGLWGYMAYLADEHRRTSYAEEQCLLHHGTTEFKQPNKIIFCLDNETSKFTQLEIKK
jgi:hypothetical protein